MSQRKTFRITLPLLVLGILVFGAPRVWADDPSARDLSLRDAITSALNKRPELVASGLGQQAATQLRKQAAYIPNPRVFYQSENLRPGADFTQNVDTYAYASEVLEVSGRRAARISVADNAVTRSQLSFEQQKRLIELHVAQAYWDAVRLQYQRRLAEQNVTYYREILDYQEKRLHEGKLAEVDVMRLRLEEVRSEASLELSRLSEAEGKQRLAREIGLPKPEAWRLSESFETLNEPQLPNNPDNPEEARIEVRSAQQAIEAARANLLSQKAQGRPDLDALFGYKRTAGMSTMIAGFQVNIPLFDRNQGAVAAAKIDVEASRASLAATQLQSKSELELARMAYEMWKRQITERYHPLLNQAIDIASIGRSAYREGGIDFLRLLDAEKLRVDTQSSWVDALSNYHQSVLALQYAEGLEP